MRRTAKRTVEESFPGWRAGLRRAREREIGRVDIEFSPRNTAGFPAAQDRVVGQGQVGVEHEYEYEYRMPVRSGKRVDSG
jgi:hypothetical protein